MGIPLRLILSGLLVLILSGCPTTTPRVTAPDLSGMTESEAAATLATADLALGSVSEAHSDSVALGRVITQSPAAGSSVLAGRRIAITISLGPNAPAEGEGEGEGEAPLRWSDPDTWNGDPPQEGDDVTIESGQHVLLDMSPPPLGLLLVQGTLEIEDAPINLTAEGIMVHGVLRVGSAGDPVESPLNIILNGMPGGGALGPSTRGIMVMGGALELYGAPPAVPWTRINAHAEAGATDLILAEPVQWRPGDELVIAPTDWYGVSQTEIARVASISGDQLALEAPLADFHWGRLQYVSESGMSLDPGDAIAPPHPDTPVVLDQRAEIGNLTRNIVIQAPDDDAWRDEGFGAHIMIMGPDSSARVDGIEIRRGGQRGRLGRYPFHWHLLSYDGVNFIADADGQFLRNSAINRSANRGVVVHGTNGVRVENNVVFDTRGHAIFTEDAVERRNTFEGNLILRVRNPDPADALKQHEIFGDGGSSGFWIANPDNITRNNAVADCQGFGYWLAFPANPWGDNIGVDMRPNRLLFGVFEDNSTHTSRAEGLMLDFVEIDNDGNVFPAQYISTTDGIDPVYPRENMRRFHLTRISTWKSGRSGIWDRSSWATNTSIVSADNAGRFFAGAGEDGLIEHCLAVGDSLNNATPRPESYVEALGGTEIPAAFATYHSTFDIRENIVVNFPLLPDTRSGAFATDDYYIRPVEKGQIRNTDNRLINSHPGYRSRSPFAHFVLAGALLDPYGIWGPAGQYIVYDEPFLTYGQPVTPVAPGPETGGVSVPGPFYGVMDFVINNLRPYYHPLMAVRATRLDPVTLDPVATWSVDAAAEDWLLSPFRHFAAHASGVFLVEFPGSPMPVDFRLGVENMLEPEDTLLLGIQFSGAVTPDVYVDAYGRLRAYTAAASLDEVRDSEGETWWQDTDNNCVWVKVRGGFWQFWDLTGDFAAPTHDELLYENTALHISTD